MKTIEERAMEYRDKVSKTHDFSPQTVDGRFIGYIKGAKEQQEIDIERAYNAIYDLIPLGISFIKFDIKNI